jgi:hypothetical protein
MKPFLAALAVLLVLPASALAMLPGTRGANPQVHSTSLAVAPTDPLRVSVPSHLPARGTDVAAIDQQSPKPRATTVYVSAPAAPSSQFDWGSAAIGAATGIAALALMLGATLALRRKRHPVAI